jgi:hypothetical protein
VVDRIFGEAPHSRRLGRIAAATVDSRGRIYAVARRTGAVHVFEPNETWLRVCEPGVREVTGELSSPQITVADSGDVYLSLDGSFDRRFLRFAPDGNSLGIERSKVNETGEKWYAQRGTERRWVLGYERIFLIDRTRVVARTIARRADGLWLEQPVIASVAPDGSIAALSWGMSAAEFGKLAVSIYSSEGGAIRTFSLPLAVELYSPEIAYDGKRIVITGAKAIVLFEASGKVIGQCTPPGDPATSCTPFLTPGGELLLYDGVKTLHRFALP